MIGMVREVTNDELIAHVANLRSTPRDRWSTRDRILAEAGSLITAKGYHGASTRDITTAVGIRQPSLFNHFASKREILAALMRLEVSIPTERAKTLATTRGSAAERLAEYMHWDFAWYANMPFDLRGLQEELVEEPGMEQFRTELSAWKRAIERIVRDGVESGEFHPVNPSLVTRMLVAVSWEVVRTARVGRARKASEALSRDAALLVLRGLLVRPESAVPLVDGDR